MSVGRVNPVGAAYRPTPGTKARLSTLQSRGVSASQYLLRSVTYSPSRSAPVHPAPRSLLAPVLKRLLAGWRLVRGRVIQARFARIESKVAARASVLVRVEVGSKPTVVLRQLH